MNSATQVKTGHLRVMQYHTAAQRKATAKELARHDIIITTYGVILSGKQELFLSLFCGSNFSAVSYISLFCFRCLSTSKTGPLTSSPPHQA